MEVEKIINEAISFHVWWVPDSTQAKERSAEVVESLRALRAHLSTGDWISIEDNLPEVDKSAFYGDRYSIPVIVANYRSKDVWPQVVRFDHLMNGYVEATLCDGADPDDYEFCYFTHWRPLPDPPSVEGE